MKIYQWLVAIMLINAWGNTKAQELTTVFEQSNGTQTVTYEEGISFLEKLHQKYPNITQFEPIGTTDIGLPLHTFVLSTNGIFQPKTLQEQKKHILLINNAIHPGEPDGVDASLMLLRDICQDKQKQKLLENTVIVVIPFYNVDGVINRGKYSRANQNGPIEYGFRGNAKNLDLNRDFIKLDSKNAQTFTQIFQKWQPDIYVENHVSNGADYQYTFTCLGTQPDKLGGALGEYLKKQLFPDLQKRMEKKKWDMTHYVNVHGTVPDSGFVQFNDSPRYSSGYAALFHTIALVPETHMLKPFSDRVKANYDFMMALLEHLSEPNIPIKTIKKQTEEKYQSQTTQFPLKWQVDKTTFEWLPFKGYTAQYIESQVTQQPRLFYDRKQPFTKNIKFYNQYKPSLTLQKPVAYLIPQAYTQIIERLQWNGVQMMVLKNNQTLQGSYYYITQFETVKYPFEGHYLHYNTQVKKMEQTLQTRAGDVLVIMNQTANRYLMETLEPEATDSFFNWNFFDAILQQKEGYSEYVFEDIAATLLQQNPTLAQMFKDKKAQDPDFAKNAEAQLDFIYKNSPYYENTHMRYPIIRIEQTNTLEEILNREK
ncbi:MAG: hypothetical protein EAZ55_01730 [Cytophagales bacterium]|nr:MAG: hypothetical protein EAZ55_01730 [Cytophagales bacterium]